MTDRPLHPFRRVLRGVLAVLAALWMVLEEWLWDSLVALTTWIARLPPLKWLERRIARLPPYAAMAMFALPWLVLLPAKIAAVWLIGTGHLRLGVLVFVVAKLIGTAVLARLFTLTKASLLQIGWFARFYAWFTRLRDRLYAYVKSLRSYQLAKALLAGARARLRRAWQALRARPSDPR
jgi:hypothetical protein